MPVTPLPGTPGKTLISSVFYFCNLQRKKDTTNCKINWFGGTSQLSHEKCLGKCLAYTVHSIKVSNYFKKAPITPFTFPIKLIEPY